MPRRPTCGWAAISFSTTGRGIRGRACLRTCFWRGVGKLKRRTYRLWQETSPALIFEITSLSTCDEDMKDKKALYESLGVEELVLFDPYGEYLEPRLQGYRLKDGCYRPIPRNQDGSLALQTVGLTVHPEGERLRLVDSATREKLLWNHEIEEARRAAERRASREAAARRAAEERAATAEERAAAAEERARSLAEELARLRGAKT